MIAAIFIFILRIIKRVATIGWRERRTAPRVCSAETIQNRGLDENGHNTTSDRSCEAEYTDKKALESQADESGKEKDCETKRPKTSDSDPEKRKVCKVKNNVDPKMIEATLSTKRDDSTLVRKVVPIGKCPKVNTSESDNKNCGKTSILVIRCKRPEESYPICFTSAVPVKEKKSVTFSLPDESERHSTGSTSFKKKLKKAKASSVGFSVSSESRIEAKAFWNSLPLVQKDYYAHEYKTLGKVKGWEMLFDELFLETNDDLVLYRDTRGQGRNRYDDVVPYYHARVKLSDPKNDYINASLVKVEEAGRRYILTQGPMDNTITHFWQMVWEQESIGIVMLCKCEEDGETLSAPYWPKEGASPVVAGCYMVECTRSDSKKFYCVSSLKLCNLETEETRTVLHFHYLSWPDVGVPQNPLGFLEFFMEVRKSGVMEPGVGPAVVHCSAGVGNSGAFTVSDACLSLLEGGKSFKTLDIKAVVLKMREQRPGLIDTFEQLRFTYLAVLNGAFTLEITPGVAALEKRVANFSRRLVKRETVRQQRKRAASTQQQPTELSEPTPVATISPAVNSNTPTPASSSASPVSPDTPTDVEQSESPPSATALSTAVADATTPPNISPSTAVDATLPPNTPPGTPSHTVTSPTAPVNIQSSTCTLARSATVQDLSSIASSPTDIPVAIEIPEEAEIASVGVEKERRQRKGRRWLKKLKRTLFQCTRGVSE